MNARHAPRTDRTRGPAAGDGLAAVLRLPTLPLLDDEPAEPTTLLILAEYHRPSAGFHTRALGLNDRLSVAETVRAVLVAFDWPGATGMLDDPDAGPAWSLQARRSDRLRVYSRTAGPIGTPLGEALGRDGTATLLADDVVLTLTTAGAMTRDEHTPDAVCLAGDFVPESRGDPGGVGRTVAADALVFDTTSESTEGPGFPRDVDLAAVNVALTGEETVEEILDGLAPELRELLLAGDLYEFTPLLQALDLGRPAQVPEFARAALDGVPAESTPVGRAAAWARIVALSTLSDRATAGEISEMLMAALGFTRADADIAPGGGRLSTDPLNAAEIRTLSAATGWTLASCGAGAGEDSRAVVTPLVPRRSLLERLEMYRYLLQRHEG
ncbi:MAG: hypothetical protein ACTH2Y_04025 [Corynebacterium sp.]|uniref:hypothetical protein n=1 Tax=unclassified Corynebacterium TaxID=2624378 RepID=UPI00264997F8|nr:hypothetical protein [Corynebacterium sp.]MDN5581486.1 hypothetical protein [Corynebacterium sp.]MDN5719568.1 hypothetical protein [Corynebacterium sp.]MDN6509116.1 hypothetical protein [Corynebacterium sp.]